jgi:hypothetical protein
LEFESRQTQDAKQRWARISSFPQKLYSYFQMILFRIF